MPLIAARSLLLALICTGLFAQASVVAKALGQDSGKQDAPAELDPLGRSTPRGTVIGFLRAIDENDPTKALVYLDTKLSGPRAVELAENLARLINSSSDLKLLSISDRPDGNAEDGLPSDKDLIGIINSPSGALEILLRRSSRPGELPVWQFSPETLKRVPEVADSVDALHIQKWVPQVLRDNRLFGIPLFRFVFLFLLFPFVLLAAYVLQIAARMAAKPALRRMGASELQVKLFGPLSLLALAFAVRLFSSYSPSLLIRTSGEWGAIALRVFGFGWVFWRLIDLATSVIAVRTVAAGRTEDKSFVWFLRRAGKAVVFIVVGISLLNLMEIKLTALLTGLGIGGIVLAFAAQKTVENLFGGLMLISDRPFRVGDFCKIGEYKGTIHDIGARSTRIETTQRTMVSIPNGQTAAVAIENFTLRDKILFQHVFGVPYSTSSEVLRKLLEDLRALLVQDHRVEDKGSRVRFVRFADSWLEIEIFAYVYTRDYPVFLGIQEELLLAIMRIVEQDGTSFAFPSRSIYVEREESESANRTLEAGGSK
jgi:MscS family membrane protein